MRDKVWGSANSLFKWRFRSRRRRWYLSSIYESQQKKRSHNFPKASVLNTCARAGSRDIKNARKTE